MAGLIGNIPVPQATQTRQSFTATASQTSFPTIGYTEGFFDCHLNGVKLLAGVDFNVGGGNGSDVILATGAALNDILEVTIFDTFNTSSGTFSSTTLKNNVTLKNDTHEDSDGGRASKIIYQGEQSGGEISTLAEIEASHHLSADDEKGNLVFRTNDGADGTSPTEVFRLDSAGRAGVGTIPAAIADSTGVRSIQLGATFLTHFTPAQDGTTSISNNVYWDGSNNKALFTGPSTSYLQQDRSHRFRTAPSVSAGANVTATEVVRIDNEGIKFNGDTAAANALDDYEEGTFNLTMEGYHGAPSPKLTIPAHYTKIGNTVNFWAHRASMNTTSYSGNISWSGLPFTSPSPYSIGTISLDHIGTYTGYGPHTLISGTVVYAVLHQSNASSWSAVMHNVHSSAGAVYLSGAYKV